MKRIITIIAIALLMGGNTSSAQNYMEEPSIDSIFQWYNQMHYASWAILPKQEEENGKVAAALIRKEVFQDAEIWNLKKLLPYTEVANNTVSVAYGIYHIRTAIISRHPAFLSALEGRESPTLWRRIAITITHKG